MIVQKKYLIKKFNSRILNKTLNSKLWQLKIKIVLKKMQIVTKFKKSNYDNTQNSNQQN